MNGNIMSNKIVSGAAGSAKTLAQQIAAQMAKEPLEVLRDIKEQTTGNPNETSPQGMNNQKAEEDRNLKNHAANVAVDRQKSERLISAFNKELDDIRKQKVFKNLMDRISAGEILPIEEYPELSMEQKQVLKAQMEAVANQRALQSQSFNDVPSIASKPSRRFGAGQKSQAQKEQTRVEKPVPPSG